MAPDSDKEAGEIIFGGGDPTRARALLRAVEAKRLRRIYSSVYTRYASSLPDVMRLKKTSGIIA